ncbi:plasmid stabilization system protein ParE [Kitasatospora sp. MAP12-15]|uniref:hypothetical protein n=1 Tax=unclassified Kitasatospora TaxID=2633591 RepID=UPI00247408C2|nr:hypothetical protein [Kitasatospora sp. MAP12-44]MDH6115608.1 chromosome segregation ATPase [Kitasatospora sp. MAP12-44]
MIQVHRGPRRRRPPRQDRPAAGPCPPDRRAAPPRRPAAPAWAVNQLSRRQPQLLQELLDLGTALRRAQAALDADTPRQLTAQRHQLLEQLTRLAARAAADAGQPLSAQAREAVERTLTAAAANEQATDQLTAGRLATALDPPTSLPDPAPSLSAVPDLGAAAQPPTSGAPLKAARRSRQQSHPGTAREERPAADEQQAKKVLHLQVERDGLVGGVAQAERAVAEVEDALEPLAELAAHAALEVERAKAALEAARFAQRAAERTEREARTALAGLRKQAEQARQRAEESESRLAAAKRPAAKRS